MDRYGSVKWKRGMQDSVYVRRLQTDLKTLGFAIGGAADGNFGRRTFWALREFQSYAKYSTVARLTAVSGALADRLEPVATGASRYDGPVSGVANDSTRALLEHWIDSA